jgi:hypothetical protein
MRFMKPIPTTYDGVQFRSRLEARWALFFDQLNILWQYEPFVIERNGKEYKPDFIVFNILFKEILLVEIKPLEPNDEYVSYLKKIRDPKKKEFLILIGEPKFGVFNGIRIFGKDNQHETTSLVPCQECGWYKFYGTHQYSFCQCRAMMPPLPSHVSAHKFASEYRFDLNREGNV